MKLRQLETKLQQVPGFDCPKIKYEQYTTPASLASICIFTAENTYQDVAEKIIIDLGCGTGMLGIAAYLMEAYLVIGIDIDSDSITLCRRNFIDITEKIPELIIGNVLSNFLRNSISDTALINPPFGTKNNMGTDLSFVEKALYLSDTVYSFHKSSTREYLIRKLKCQVIAQTKYELFNTYKFHKKEKVVIDVDIIRLEK